MRFMRATKHTIRLATVAVALALSSPAAYAQQPSAAAMSAAKEIVKAMDATMLFNPLIPGVVEQAKNLFLQQNPNLVADLNEVAAKMRHDLAPRQEELSNEVARLYTTLFTEQELKEILAFYTAPTGKKMLAEQPKVLEGSMKFAQDWANKLSDEVIAKMRDEMKKRGHAL
jgi:hypothetical protein